MPSLGHPEQPGAAAPHFLSTLPALHGPCAALVPLALLCLAALGAAEVAPSEQPQDDQLCGPLCLAFCAEWLDVKADVDRIAKSVRAERGEGSSLTGLQHAAGELGLEARPYAMRLGHLKRLSARTPGIAHVDGNHFIVAWWDGGSVIVADPPGSTERVALEDFGRRWDGAILVVSRPGEQAAVRRPPWWFWAVLAAAGAGCAAAVLVPRLRRRAHRIPA